jgi:DNA-binding NarL/FixJ family response regulator
MIRVAVVDDHAIVRTGLAQLLSTAPDIELVGMAEDGAAALDLIAAEGADVVLMDLSMPVMDGIQATRLIVERHPESRVVVLTSMSEHSRIVEALNAGADGYILKHAAPDELLNAIRAAHDGGVPLDPIAARAMLTKRQQPRPDAGLTDRERQVLHLVGDGLPNKQIARRLEISERTVKAHLTSIFQRIGVRDRTQAALWVERNINN